ncbi:MULTISPECIES: ESPR-type extended signal peptide-containing protein [Stenotrophomonas]|uniref:ESPR-type extended signal peptide-containing protein n=1 Tax=Stenotrophomonas TaxID=40323 RepID=UPI0018D457BB|nr:ESPR-type extended signal peptide-containing protein [Stenotrophomonas maltophilia]MBA2128958.1 autotransporter [Stenotrophomonas maltophilia]MBH1682191.1 YadA-like family protein [Stenotrophomonas maltophilia]MBH1875148.1 YadA-like family protein [Stenotrophomonas maltophilia]
MNHIYRRIWNHAKQCWVVGSELSSARGKRASGRATAHGLIVLSVIGLVPAGVAASEVQEQVEEREYAKSLGLRNTEAKDIVSVAVPFSSALGTMSVSPLSAQMSSQYLQLAIVSDTNYRDSTISGNHMLVLGSRSSLRGNYSVGYGSAISTSGEYNTAVGYNAVIGNGYSTAIGARAQTSGIGATALGNNALAMQTNSVAIGSGSYASSSNSIAIGANSVADSSYTVSVGNSTTKRKIVNVAAGNTSYGSSDAVTGGQLYETNQAVSSVRNTANSAYSTASTAQTTANSARTNADSALSKANTLGGLLSQTSVSGNVRLGGGNSGAVLDVRNSANANRKITGVADATLSATSTEAVSGKQLNATNSNLTAARSVADSAKVNADSALSKANTLTGLLSQASASGNVRVGASNSGTVLDVRNNANASRKITGVADAVLSATSTEAVSGKQLNATNSNVTTARSVADTAKTNADSALTKANTLSGLLSQTSASGNVRLGEKNSGTVLDVRNSANASRKITGVVDAALSSTSTDAVTGRQLNATNSNVSTALSDASAAKTTANTALTQVGTLNGLLSQGSASGNVRIGEKNSGTVLDVRNSASVNRKLTGVADGVVSASSYEAVNGRQLNATNDKVAMVEGIAKSAGAEAAAAKTDAAKALAETAVLGGLVAQVSASGSVRLGEKNSGTTLDVRNSVNANRKISGVADGLLNASSNQAVSGKQLYSTNSRVLALEGVSQFVSIGVAPSSERADAGPVGVALGNSAKTGSEGGTAVGTHAKSLGRNSVAVGRASTVHEGSENGFALGVGAEVGIAEGGARGGVAIGAGAKVGKGADGSLAIGEGSQANEAGVASFGSATAYRRLVNVARGTADHNATTVSQLKDSLATLGGGAGLDGNGSIIAPTYAVQGGTQNTVEDALMALDGAVITAGRRADKVESQLSSIFQDSPSARADGMSQIALNGVNGMVLTNLADGRVAPGSRDAVNGGQLHSMQQQLNGRMDGLEQRIDDAPPPRALASSSVPKPQAEDTPVVPEGKDSQQVASVGEGDKPTPQPKANKDDSPKPQVDTAELEKMLARANEYTDGAISNFERRLDKMDKRFNRMAAMSSAQTAMAMNTAGLATYNRLGAGVGYSEGESAMAVGYQRVLNEKGSATFSLNGAFTNSGERSMGVGVGIGW